MIARIFSVIINFTKLMYPSTVNFYFLSPKQMFNDSICTTICLWNLWTMVNTKPSITFVMSFPFKSSLKGAEQSEGMSHSHSAHSLYLSLQDTLCRYSNMLLFLQGIFKNILINLSMFPVHLNNLNVLPFIWGHLFLLHLWSRHGIILT